ncbi:MAG TPA: SDR family oxidoreductase [Polyangiales bacterium]|nr:SDR family oxidoreductase [Polyangiales bacterium]
MFDSAPSTLSVRQALAGRHVFLTGGSGFVGKVWLSMVLAQLPEIERVYVFLRPKALVPARQRFEKMLNTSAGFKPLHDRFGARLSEYLAERVEVVEGDLCAPDLGLAPDLVRRLRRDLDVFVHCAGLVDFNPDLRKALDSNVDASLRVAEFVERCDHASMLHISTCYVAGRRYGEIPEKIVPDFAPVAENYCAATELQAARAKVAELVSEHESLAAAHRAREQVLLDLQAEGRAVPAERTLETLTRKLQRQRLKDALVDEGMERARALGWPNTYTYSKSMAESLLSRRPKLRLSVLRPSIVESALEFPFPGWNESFNGTAPLAYIMGSWFRMVPARPDAPFDVIPVDLVCKAMVLATAALAVGRAEPVYHVGTSHRHRCSVGRAAELIVLSHRRHYRQRNQTRGERVLKSRWDAVLREPDNPLGVRASRAVLHGVEELIDLLPDKLRKKTGRLERRLREMDSDLSQIERLVELYLPFMYESLYVFESRAVDKHQPLEPEFTYAPEAFDWRRYWLDVHMPGLRRWAFPLIEGRRPERYRAEHVVRLSALQLTAAGEAVPHPATEALASASEV